MEEVFKKHKSGYLVSNYGRIKGKTKEFLKLSKSSSGYLISTIGLVHRVVYETFNGDILNGNEINHLDRNKENNHINNLESVTKSENQKHRYRNSIECISGEKNPMSFLMEKDILSIYEMFRNGISNYEIAEKYNIHDRYVSCIRSGKRWKTLFDIYMRENIKSLGCNSLPQKTLLDIIDKIVNTDKSNEEISKEYFLDKTTISKVRNKRIWHRAWKLYYKNYVL